MSALRYATATDVPAIVAIMEAAFQEYPSAQHVAEVLEQGRNKIWILEQGGQAVGFVSGFLTKVSQAIRRWEVDLLAVHPHARGKGYGRELLRSTLQDARNHRANFSRGLVRVENKPAQYAFKIADFHTTGQIYSLYTWQPADLGVIIPEDNTITVLEVNTANYKGIWLEGLNAPYLSAQDRAQYIEGACTRAAQHGLAMVSSLVPVKYQFAPECLNGSTLVGQYQWWRRP